MADSNELKQAIDGAILDADSLERFVNGSESETVLTRLSAQYPTIKNMVAKIKNDAATDYQALFDQLMQEGNIAGRFKTLAELEASGLPSGSYALVADDTDDKNGIYIKNEAGWSKSSYDFSRVLAKIIEHQDGDDLFTFSDATGIKVASIDEKGGLSIYGLDDTVQDNIKRLSSGFGGALTLNDNSAVALLQDVTGIEVASVAENGDINLTGLDNSVQKEIKQIKASLSDFDFSSVTPADSSSVAIKGFRDMMMPLLFPDIDKPTFNESLDSAMSKHSSGAILREDLLVDSAGTGSQEAKVPVLIRTGKNSYYLMVTEGTKGDWGVSHIYGRKITVNDKYEVRVSEPYIINPNGGGGGTGLYVHTGEHRGRIYCYYIRRQGMVKDDTYYRWSDDGGETWSDEHSMEPFIPNYEQWRLTIVSPAKCIQLTKGEYAGRIILPCWHADPDYPTSLAGVRSFIMYSNDGGETYSIGAESTQNGSNESAVAEFDGGIAFLTRDVSRTKTVEYSYDGGQTFSGKHRANEVLTTTIQSGFLQAENLYDLSTPKLVMTTPMDSNRGRRDLGICISYNNKDFTVQKVIQSGFAGYSDIEVIDETTFLVVYVADDYKKINSIVVNLNKITK